MSPEHYTQAADDALAAALEEQTSSDASSTASDFDVLDALSGDSPSMTTVDGATTLEPLCDEDTARGLVKQVQNALEQFDSGIQQIIRLRAWEPLGYDDPREFVLAEFGPTDDPNAVGRVSRVHAYRLARLAVFMYGLADRLGDVGAALDLSERALRSLPAGQGGVNDMAVLERMEKRVAELDHDLTPDEAQQVLDDVLTKARSEVAEHGRLRDSSEEEDPTDDDPWGGFDTDKLASLSIDPDALSDDAHSNPEDTPEGFDLDALDEAPEDPAIEQQQGASRNDLVEAYGSADASAESIEHTQRLSDLIRGLQSVAAIEELLPEIVDYADDQEITDLAELADRTVKVAEALIEAANSRSGEMFTDGDF